jgi:hypothetical protein
VEICFVLDYTKWNRSQTAFFISIQSVPSLCSNCLWYSLSKASAVWLSLANSIYQHSISKSGIVATASLNLLYDKLRSLYTFRRLVRKVSNSLIFSKNSSHLSRSAEIELCWSTYFLARSVVMTHYSVYWFSSAKSLSLSSFVWW